jgi:hypothetical protein
MRFMSISYARSISWSFLLWAAVGIGAAQTTSRPVFLKREIVSQPEKTPFFALGEDGHFLELMYSDLSPLVLTPSPQYDVPIEANYTSIDAEKSLLIHDCDGFCNDQEFSFATIFARAARYAGLSDSSKASQSWFDSAKKTIPDFLSFMTSNTRTAKSWTGQTPEGAPFQLLAVVNRMDFATTACDKKDSGCGAGEPKWRNAELHLVYGLVQNGQAANFTLIIEFVLPPLSWHDFRTMEGKWNDLRLLNGDSYTSGLKAVVAGTPILSARMRTNSEVGAGPWFLAQWDFSANGLKPTSLPEQIRIECSRPGHDSPFANNCACPKAEPAKCGDLAKLWNDYAQTPKAQHLPVPYTPLLPMTQCYDVNGPFAGTAGAPAYFEGMDSAPGKCSDTDMFARRVIALQQCSMCHGPETNNPEFTHIHKREPSTTVAGLSKFLTGNVLKPTYEQLKPNAPVNQAVFTAWVNYNAPGCKPSDQTIPRRFHDLGRRSLFLAAVLVNGPETPPDGDLTGIIQDYGPDFVH